MNRLLIIGAGIGQVCIIKKAKALGSYVAVVTQKGEYPGIELADDVCYCDIYDRDTIVEWAKEHRITAVTSDQNDLMMPTVAYIAEKLNLPGNTFKQVMSYCNKNIFRDNCDRLGIPGPKHISVDTADFDFSSFDYPFPWVVKPADSQSSVGVKKVENERELREALSFALSKSKTGRAIVENFFVGDEIVCEGFINNGQYYLLSFADRRYFDLKDLMIPTQTVFPSIKPRHLLNKVLECEQKMAQYINPQFAIVHSEYLINEETEEICVVESALRGGGVYISSHLIPYATEVDINDVLLKRVLGIDIDVESIMLGRANKAAAYICFYLPEGRVFSVTGIDELKKMPFVKMVSLDNITIGMKTEKMLHKGLRKGPILVTGENRENLETNIKAVQNTLKIEVINNIGEIQGIIWS